MPVPLPAPDDAKLGPPDAEEVRLIVGGVAAAVAPGGELTALQRFLIDAIVESMTGFVVPVTALPRLGPEEYARALARRDGPFRSRMVQLMLLCELVLVPLPEDVADRVERYAAELCVDDSMLRVTRRLAQGSLGLALFDFQRSGYMETWEPARAEQLHTSRELTDAWEQCVQDDALAARWRALAECPEGSLGRAVSRFYAARGFSFPGTAGSAPPLLAQHDWVHVLADYGSTVESEIETFALIARANDDPRAFSLLAMVVSLFETGYLAKGAGLFEYDRGHLGSADMAVRLADAMRRGALCGAANHGVDLLAVDWFDYAERPIDDVRDELGVVAKSERALDSGSVGPWEHGGISPYQYEHARRAAQEKGIEYGSFGATPSGAAAD
jgi:hypothetical protein